MEKNENNEHVEEDAESKTHEVGVARKEELAKMAANMVITEFPRERYTFVRNPGEY